jgi:cytoskeleton protein RodZ
MHDNELVMKHSISEASTLGVRLQHAREMRGLSRQEVARALCLNVDIIRALEQDDYEQFTAPVFIKGYLRNYMNYLQLPVTDLQSSLSFAHHVGAKKAPQRKILAYLPIIGQIFLRLLNYAIVVTLIILVFIWWHERHSAEEKTLTMIRLENPH